jgi:hypothetical protein
MISLKWLKENRNVSRFLEVFFGVLLGAVAPVTLYTGNSSTTSTDLSRLTLEELMVIQATSVSKGEEDFSKAPSAIFVLISRRFASFWG